MESGSYVPYQAFGSQSGTPTPPASSSIPANYVDTDVTRGKRREESLSPAPTIRLDPPPASSNGLPSPPDSAHSHDEDVKSVSSTSEASTSSRAVRANGAIPSPTASTSAHLPNAQDTARPSGPRKSASTFRHIPLKPVRPSPLNPNSQHGLRAASDSGHRSPISGTMSEPQTRTSSFHLAQSPTDRRKSTLSPLSAQALSLPATSPSPSITTLPEEARPTSAASSPAPIRSAASPQHPAVSVSVPTSPRIASPGASRTSTPHSNNKPLPPTRAAPYRPGFQPKGVYRPRTDEFLAHRRIAHEGNPLVPGQESHKRIERTKLERRLEKLIALHFPPAGAAQDEKGSLKAPSPLRRRSSLFDMDFRSMSFSDASSELLRGVLESRQSQKDHIRSAEQRIAPWEDDASVTKCPCCGASFHPLTNRKHHCRLCGKIICRLPIKRPQRPVMCSSLFVVDRVSRHIEEVEEGVDYGVRKRRASMVPTSPTKNGSSPLVPEDEEKFLKGVRICRDCRPILLRQQYEQERHDVPQFVRFYEAFLNLENEIEEYLPQFQELLLTLSHDDQPTKEASVARKRLLEAFAQYDALAKRIRKLPCPGGPGSSQDRVQAAIMNRASAFLQKNMFPLQSLPRPKQHKKSCSTASSPAPEPPAKVDPDSDVARALQPLLEQEALIESFVEEAKAHRKFEDVKTLKANLAEIRGEIERILANANAHR
ncbi:FYVE zinc finger-domain-containing protein [Schizophyllum fasciatum]